jgi:WD40 repeat protein
LAAQSDLARAEEDYPLAVRLARAALEPLLRPTKESEQDRALRAMQLKDAEQRLLPAAFKAQGALMRAVSESPQLRLLAGHTDAVNTAVFSPDGKFIVTASDDHTTRIWSLQGDAPVVMLKGAKIAALSPDGSLIASSLSDTAMGPDTNMQLWDSRTGSKIRALDGPGSRVVSSLEFSPGGDRVVSAGYDGTRVWDVKTGRQRAFLPMVREDSEEPLATFSVDGKLAVSGWSDHKVSVFSGTNFGATKVIGGDHGSIGAIRFSPDGLQLAVAGDDGLVRIWSVETSQIENTLTGHEGPVKSVAYSVDGERIATSSIDGTARIWDRRSGVQLKIFRGHSGPVRSVAFNRDGSQLVTAGGSFGTGDNTARVWDARVTAAVSANKLRISPDEIKTALAGFFATPWAFPFLRAAISPDGSLIATTSGEFYTPQEGDKSVRLWDALTGKQVSIFKISQDTTGEAEGRQGADHPMFSADGKRLAVLCGQSCAVPYRLWDLAAGTELTQPLTGDGQYSFPHTAALSKDGMELAVGGEGGVVIVFDLRNFRVLRSLQPHVGDVEAIAFSAEGGRIATGSTDFTAQIWNVSGAPGLIPLRGHTGTVNAVAFSPDGATVVTGSEDRTLRIWDAKTGAELSTMRGHRGGVSSVAFSHDGSRIVTAGAENMVRVWDVAGGVELASFRGHRGNINRASFSEDDKHIVSIGQDKTVRIWALPRKLAARGVELIEAAKVFGVLDQGECDSFPDACHDP